MKPLVCGINAGISGYYTFHKKLPNGDLMPLLDGAKSKNLIVDQWLNAYKSFVNSQVSPSNTVSASSAGIYSIMTRVAVGTGSTAPTVNDTGLVSTLASKTENNDTTVSNTYSYDSDTDTFEFVHSKSFPFPLGGVVGNISEVAVFSNSTTSTTYNTLVSRALIVDSLGDPSTITLTAEDQLVVTYTMVLQVPRTISFNFSYNAVDYVLEGKLSTTNPDTGTGFSRLLASSAASVIAKLSRSTDVSYPSATANGLNNNTGGWTSLTGAAGISLVTPLNPSSVRKTRIRFPLASSNYTEGIKCFALSNTSGWMFKFTPAFPKTANEILEIEFATDFVRL
jgi:hypothetical protein